VSYFRPPKARKTGPWSITRLSNSTQKMSQKGGRVSHPINRLPACLSLGVQSKDWVTQCQNLNSTIDLFWSSPPKMLPKDESSITGAEPDR